MLNGMCETLNEIQWPTGDGWTDDSNECHFIVQKVKNEPHRADQFQAIRFFGLF